MPFSSNSPRSTSSARAVPSTPYTVSDARMPPAGATPSMRLAMITVSPWRSPLSSITSPVCRPMRMTARCDACSRLRASTAIWISRAHATARRADWNATIRPSPSPFTTTPRWRSISSSAACSSSRRTAFAASSPSCWFNWVDSTRSVNSTVTVPSGSGARLRDPLEVGRHLPSIPRRPTLTPMSSRWGARFLRAATDGARSGSWWRCRSLYCPRRSTRRQPSTRCRRRNWKALLRARRSPRSTSGLRSSARRGARSCR